MEDAGTGGTSGKRALDDNEKKTQHEHDSLKLSRAYLLHRIESSSNERYTETLRKALSEIEQKLAKLETDS